GAFSAAGHELDALAGLHLGRRAVEDRHDPDAFAAGPLGAQLDAPACGDVGPCRAQDVERVDEHGGHSRTWISAAARRPDRSAPSIEPVYESVCSPASSNRPCRRRSVRQYLVTCPGEYTAAAPRLGTSFDHAAAWPVPTSAREPG